MPMYFIVTIFILLIYVEPHEDFFGCPALEFAVVGGAAKKVWGSLGCGGGNVALSFCLHQAGVDIPAVSPFTFFHEPKPFFDAHRCCPLAFVCRVSCLSSNPPFQSL